MILNAGDKFTLNIQFSNGTLEIETFKKIDNSSQVGFTYLSYLSSIKDSRLGSLLVPGIIAMAEPEGETILGVIELA